MIPVRDQVYDIIAKEAPIERARIVPEATLKDLEIASLDAVQIIFAIEERFEIYMPYNNPSFDVDTVAGLVDTVERLLREKQTA